jgi:hypothetical protein
MKKLIVVANDLERSGKSVLARAVVHHLKERDARVLLVTSNEMDVTDEFAGDFWDLEDQFEVSSLIAALDRHDAVVLDLHSGAARNWGEFCESEDLENLLVELESEMTLLIPNNQSERCNEEIVDLAEIFSDSADYAIAHLPGGERAVKWKGSPAEKAIRYFGASELRLPDMGQDLVTAIESTDGDFVQALNDPSNLPRFAEVQVAQWLDKASAALAEAGDYLVPEAVNEVALDY